MKAIARLTTFLVLHLALSAAAVARDGTIAIAIVPTVKGSPTADGAFPISYDPNDPKSAQGAALAFDLRAIPAGAVINAVTLRLVLKGSVRGNQLVRIFPGSNSDRDSIGQLNPGLSTTSPSVNSAGSGLMAAVVDAKARGAVMLDLYLARTAGGADRVFFFTDTVDSPNRPRLIVSWNDTTPSVVRTGAQLRYRGDPGDMTPWSHAAPQGAAVSTLIAWLKLNQILTGPAFRADEILLIAAPTTDTTVQRLYGFGWNGNKRWEAALPNAPWKYLHVDEQGRVLAFRNDGKISVFENFGPTGPETITEYPVAGLRLSRRPAVSAGGIVVFRNETGSLQAHSPFPVFREIWRTATIGLSSMPVLSPRPGDDITYVMGDRNTGLRVLDTLTGESRLSTPLPGGSKLSGFPDFHPPLTVEGAAHDWVFLSTYSQEGGRLEGYNDFTQSNPSGWTDGKDGPVSRCVAPPGNAAMYCVQNGQLRSFDIEKATGCASNEPPFTKGGKTYQLSATSNLVADGNGAIYFWDQEAGLFYGFDRDCKKLFGATLGGSLPAKTDGSEVVELRAGPNGVFYVTSDKQLFAIEPLQSAGLTALVASTRYATAGSFALSSAIAAPKDGPVIVAASQSLAFGNFQVRAGADVTCSAGKGISFGAGFKVESGGVLRCGIAAP